MTLKGRQDESIRQDLVGRFDPCYVAQNGIKAHKDVQVVDATRYGFESQIFHNKMRCWSETVS
jgi:hypothetical protein